MIRHGIAWRLRELVDWVVSSWPSAGGGIIIRRLIWGPRFKKCGDRVSFGDRLVVKGFSNISLGDAVSIMSGCFLFGHDGSEGLSIGDRCALNHNVLVGASGGAVRIGKNVLVGPNVVIRCSDHIFDDPNTPIREQGHRFGEIIIEDDVWIGANVVVLGGAHIGNGSVVGAGSVVRNRVPAMTVVAGVPARPVKGRDGRRKFSSPRIDVNLSSC